MGRVEAPRRRVDVATDAMQPAVALPYGLRSGYGSRVEGTASGRGYAGGLRGGRGSRALNFYLC